jgi:hypothetical protein
MASSFTCAPQTTRIEPWRGVPDMPTQVAACVGRSWAGGWPAEMQCLYDSSSQTGIDFSIRSLSCDRSHDKWSMQSRCITFLTTVSLDDVTTSSSRRGVHSTSSQQATASSPTRRWHATRSRDGALAAPPCRHPPLSSPSPPPDLL